MLNIVSHQGNANQSHELLLRTPQNGSIKLTTIGVGECVEQPPLVIGRWGCLQSDVCLANQFGSFL